MVKCHYLVGSAKALTRPTPPFTSSAQSRGVRERRKDFVDCQLNAFKLLEPGDLEVQGRSGSPAEAPQGKWLDPLTFEVG